MLASRPLLSTIYSFDHNGHLEGGRIGTTVVTTGGSGAAPTTEIGAAGACANAVRFGVRQDRLPALSTTTAATADGSQVCSKWTTESGRNCRRVDIVEQDLPLAGD